MRVVLALITAALLAGCAGSRYESLGKSDADAIMAGMARAHFEAESFARTVPLPPPAVSRTPNGS
jgi:hypothetical protein